MFELFFRTKDENVTFVVRKLRRSYIFTFKDNNPTRSDPEVSSNEAVFTPYGFRFINDDEALLSSIDFASVEPENF